MTGLTVKILFFNVFQICLYTLESRMEWNVSSIKGVFTFDISSSRLLIRLVSSQVRHFFMTFWLAFGTSVNGPLNPDGFEGSIVLSHAHLLVCSCTTGYNAYALGYCLVNATWFVRVFKWTNASFNITICFQIYRHSFHIRLICLFRTCFANVWNVFILVNCIFEDDFFLFIWVAFLDLSF